jgi:hypothetical protein
VCFQPSLRDAGFWLGQTGTEVPGYHLEDRYATRSPVRVSRITDVKQMPSQSDTVHINSAIIVA